MTARTYQRRIASLRRLVEEMQWVQPMYNGSPSCAACGEQKHHGCAKWCPAAAVTGNGGTPEVPA